MFKLSQDGIKIAKVLILVIALSFVLGKFITLLSVGLLILFRDENRIITNPNAVLSPCDGIVLSIENNVKFNLSDKYQNNKWNKITILNGILDIHANRMPMSGEVEEIIYTPGDSRDRYIYKQNEKISWIINGDIDFILSHSVDTIFHVVSSKVKKNQFAKIGETYANSFIGATIELYLPQDIEITISEGQKMVASETSITNSIVKNAMNQHPSKKITKKDTK
ncbi:hypothetical protein FZC35_01570 [Candidatus Cytomitobacter indipagum]|uniref:Phosphatidylserine decarboxylase n=1 Tax=Candidatus Cytomitobacter indipagum TaxID=2601575 RepID=A0A5C0UED4_9PROT|nr:phosphatidylserine decarboxylase [Candidatus Cytomitobacter indipagum]QEK38060.1 hypothetical protein FZC35_01570 [Candidatus Cytomitobacter indipagum]